jgi:hypothetical protein
MEGSRLSPLQERVLAILAKVEPPLTLTGGAALAARWCWWTWPIRVRAACHSTDSVEDRLTAVEHFD